MRLVRGLGSLVALVVLVVGIPAALIVLNPIPAPWTWSVSGLTQPQAPERILLGVLAAVAWLAWAGIVICVATEVVNQVSGRRLQVPLGPGGQVGQKLAAALIVAVVAMIATPQTGPAPAQAEPQAPTPRHDTTHAVDTQTPAAAPSAGAPARTDSPRSQATDSETGDREVIHVVERGEHLWTLAEQYLGDGAEWREIAELNQLDNPSRLAIGQKLRILVPAAAEVEGPGEVTVRPGDTLSALSEQAYGSPEYWQAIFEANRSHITDPDQIDVGQVLTLPDITTDARPHRDTQRPSTPETEQEPEQESDRSGPEEARDNAADDGEHGGDSAPIPVPAETPPVTQQPNPQQDHPGSGHSGPGERDTSEETGTENSEEGGDDDLVLNPAAIAGSSVGLLLASGLVAGLAARRHRQRATRRPGRCIPAVSDETATFESAVRAQDEPFMVSHLDRITRAIAAHAGAAGTDVPVLSAARVAPDRVDLLLAHAAPHPPPGVDLQADGSVWTVHAAGADLLTDIDGLDETPAPWPALVTLGRDAETAEILIDLESAAALTITADTRESAAAMLATVALELAVSPWAEDLSITLVGQACPELDPALAHPSVQHIDNVDRVLDGLEVRAQQQRAHLEGDTDHDEESTSSPLGQNRLDPALADAWAPRIVLLGDVLSPSQAARLGQIVTDLPRVAIAAVTTSPSPLTDWKFDLTGEPAIGRLAPHGWSLTPNLVSPDAKRHILDLLANSTTEHTDPAPWWNHDAHPTEGEATVTVLHGDRDEHRDPDASAPDASDDADAAPSPETPPATQAAPAPASRSSRPKREPLSLHALLEAPEAAAEDDGAHAGWTEAGTAAELPVISAPEHPQLQLLGTPDILAAGGQPTRNPGRCMEVALYLMDHPGVTTHGLAEHLCKSRATAKSVVSYLRSWLGADPDGTLFLPEATAGGGGYRLDPRVTTDWHRVRALLTGGVNTAPTDALTAALDAIQGPPLKGAEDWLTYPSLHAEIVGTLVDAAHVLVHRALGSDLDDPHPHAPHRDDSDHGDVDIDLAQWAATQGLLVQDDSEILLADMLRIHAHTGDTGAARQVGRRIARNARALGVDVAPETSRLLRAAY